MSHARPSALLAALRGIAPAWFLDLDGTLLDIAPAPDAVWMAPGLAADLVTLRGRSGGALCVLTGRNLATLDSLLGLPDLAAAGLHGLELRLPGGKTRHAPPSPALDAARDAARAFAAARPGVLLEDKGGTFALHTRACPEREAEVATFAAALPGVAEGRLVVQPGAMVAELRAPGTDKGDALRRFMGAPPFAGRIPVAIGDDLTDEAAFAAALDLGGLAVRVGKAERPSLARLRLTSPTALRALLRHLADGTEPSRDNGKHGPPGASA